MSFWRQKNTVENSAPTTKKKQKNHDIRALMHKYGRLHEAIVLGRNNRFEQSTITSIFQDVRQSISATLRPKLPTTIKKPKNILGFLSESLTFTTSTLIIFLLLLLFSNINAYTQVATYWWDTYSGKNAHVAQNLEKLAKVDEQNRETSSGSQIKKITTGITIKNTHAASPMIEDIIIPVYPPDNRIVIPKIGQNIPIQEVSTENLLKENWQALEDDIQKSLEKGVVHYPGTAVPGQIGNVFITGHSSYYVWSPGKYKDTFALLHNVEVGDSIIVYYNENKYTYLIEDVKIVHPDQVDVLKQSDDKRLTLMTCTPIGTALNRLIITAKQI